jgi:hypothetical protein
MIYIVQFTEGELAELLFMVRQEADRNEFLPEYWRRLANQIQSQVNNQLHNPTFQCAVCIQKAGLVRKS